MDFSQPRPAQTFTVNHQIIAVIGLLQAEDVQRKRAERTP